MMDGRVFAWGKFGFLVAMGLIGFQFGYYALVGFLLLGVLVVSHLDNIGMFEDTKC
jgi:hypothetical protein